MGILDRGEGPEMTAGDVRWFLSLMDALDIRIWLDGGWAVDACLGEQTRRHSDLDIVIERRDVDAAVAALRSKGYAPIPRDDTRLCNFVLGDDAGHEVDVHVIVVDEDGAGVYGPASEGVTFPAASLRGYGTVDGREVACISPTWQVAFRTGYALDENDWADVLALCQRFGIRIPDEFDRFRS